MPGYRRRRFNKRKRFRRASRRKNVLKLSRLPRRLPGSTFVTFTTEDVSWADATALFVTGATRKHTFAMNSLDEASTSLLTSGFHARSTWDSEMYLNAYDDFRVIATKIDFIIGVDGSTNANTYDGLHCGVAFSTQPGTIPSDTICQTYTAGTWSSFALSNDMMNPKLITKFVKMSSSGIRGTAVYPIKRAGIGYKLFRFSLFVNLNAQIEDYRRNDLGWCAITGATGARSVAAPATPEKAYANVWYTLNGPVTNADSTIFFCYQRVKHYCHFRHPRDVV